MLAEYGKNAWLRLACPLYCDELLDRLDSTRVKADLWMFARMDRSQDDTRGGGGGGRRDLSINHPSFLFIFHLVCPESRDYLSMLSQSWLITPPDQNNGGMSAVSSLSVGRSS